MSAADTDAPSRLENTRLGRFFTVVDRIGRRIPHPFMLFVYLLIALGVISAILSAVHATARIPGAATAEPVRGVLSVTGIQHLLSTFVDNFIGYPPLGVVLAVLLGVGVAERSGFLETVVSVVLAKVPRWLMPYAVTFIAGQGHVMGDASMVILPPLAALAFRAVGRHPVAGMLGSFASTTVGYASGVMIGALDANLSTITGSVTPHGLHLTTSVVMNYFFQAASGLVLPLLTGFILVRWVEPTLPPYVPGAGKGADGDDSAGEESAGEKQTEVATPAQRRGLVSGVMALGVFLVAILCCWLIPGGPLQGPDGALLKSPFFDGVVTFVLLAFLICGIAYGIPAGTIRRASDVPRLMGESLQSMLGYIVIAFSAGQFIAMFNWSHVGDWLAVEGAGALRGAHLTGFPALLLAMLFSALLSLVVFSGASLWTVLAPVLVPVFTGLGYHPGVVQAAYRVGDSVTHPISPLNPYVYMLELSVRKYDPKFTLGMIFARMSLFVLPVAALWVAVFAVFYFAGIPFGPGVPTHITP
ncbi:AbgT family transporter [Streptomyces sp. 150FB]|uniref:AbgT family transporter n=1 Tax=Streptomyces sp. 150FB TaxID=1576605 RepID=UPI0006978ECC|nr:AbgT family transporter [Streptomyces sp. 150FB]